MAQPEPETPRARLFVALDIPELVRESIGAWQASALADPALRPVDPVALHVTLCFLGSLPEGRIGDVRAALAAVPTSPVPMRLERQPLPLPPRGRARLYAISTPSEAATALQRQVSEGLEGAGLYAPERREFWPHLTVARVRAERRSGGSGRRPGGQPMAVGEAPPDLPADALEPFEAVRLTLYRSNLRSHGAEYVPLTSTDLTSRPAGEAQKE